MKANQGSFLKSLFTVAMLCTLLLTQSGSAPIQELTGIQADLILGGWDWGKFANGLACGAGIVGIAAGGASGLGAPAAVLAVSSVAAACVGMF
jgi:hypothetical protein